MIAIECNSARKKELIENINQYDLFDIIRVDFGKDNEVVKDWNLPIGLLIIDVRFQNYEEILQMINN